MNPKITIITISYNSENTIERTIKSVINQNYDNLEYIIIDGGSSDNTLNIIKKYSDYITKWVSEKDEGISDAFNKGISFATGDVIGIINSDDGLEPGALNKLASCYETDVDVYRGNILFWNEESNKKIREIPSMKLNYSGLGLRFCHQGTFVSRKAYYTYGVFNKDYKYNMDYDLLIRFQNNGAKFKYIDFDMAYFTMKGITFSEFTKSQREEWEKIIATNGGTKLDIMKYRIVKFSKMVVKKFVHIDTLLRIKNIKDN